MVSILATGRLGASASVAHSARRVNYPHPVICASYKANFSGRALNLLRCNSGKADGAKVEEVEVEVEEVSVSKPTEQEVELERITEQPVVEGKYLELALYVAASVVFGIGIWNQMGGAAAEEYFAGYLLEQSLSIDNLFVFVLVFKYFKTPAELEPKILSYGIASAAVLRGIMVILGVELIENFKPILGFFAAILLYSSYNLLTAGEDEDEEDLSDNAIVKFCKKLVNSTDKYDGDKFFTLAEDGISKVATPMLLTLAVVELSDVVFAVDSVPAVFGVTQDPFIVYSSNIFAILSLRSLFFFVSTVMSQLRYLDKAVALVLGFVGVKMLLGLGGFEIGTDVSLITVASVLAAGVVASLVISDEDETNKEL